MYICSELAGYEKGRRRQNSADAIKILQKWNKALNQVKKSKAILSYLLKKMLLS